MPDPTPLPSWTLGALLLSVGSAFGAILAIRGNPDPRLALALAIVWLAWNSWLIGRLLFRNQGVWCQLGFGAASLAGLVSVAGAACYYLWIWDSAATLWVIAGISAIAALGLVIQKTENGKRNEAELIQSSSLVYLAQGLLTLVWISAMWITLHAVLTHATGEPIRSPWAALPGYTTAAFAIATAALVALSAIATRPWPLLLWASHGTMLVSVAWLTYTTGYGFDPYVHQATEKLLLTNGTFSPAPPYYLGQYALVTLLQRLTHLPLVSIDRALVPLAAGILLPLLAFWTIRRNFKTKVNIALLSAGAVLAVPLAPFIMTTPHALALIYSCAAVAAAVFFLEQKLSAWAMLIAAAGAAATHPLVGIPVATFVVLVAAWRRARHSTMSSIIFWILCALAPFTVPAMFVANGIINPANAAQVSYSTSAGASLLGGWILPHWITMFDVRDGAYLYLFNLPVIGLVLIAATLVFLWRRARLHRLIVLALGAAATALGAAILAGTLQLNFLIDYERSAFADRLLLVATIIASPLVLLGIYRVIRRLQMRGLFGNVALVGLLTGGISMGFFLTYPTFDQYRKDRGYNTASVDFDAVRRIEADAGGKPYVVLANQATAAAAVDLFGFGRSYKGNYFYPLPTGSPLYQLYLDYVYGGPSQGTISKVRELTGVQRVYVAVSSYWDSFDRIEREAQATTPKWFTVGATSTVDVFRYD